MEIVGHEKIRTNLTNLVKEDKVGHAYLFCGKEGIGKQLVAKEFAKNMMCIQPVQGRACQSCDACLKFESGADFRVISPEKNLIRVDAIREFEEEVYLKPINSKRKCFIINDSEMMNESSQNALLKVLEEPPSYVTIILITSNKSKLLYTIQSRVTKIDFNPLHEEEMRMIIDEQHTNLILYAGGSVQKLLKLASSDYVQIAEKLLEVFDTKNFLAINHQMNELKRDKALKENMNQILETLMIVSHQHLKEDVKRFMNYIKIFEQTNNNLQKNANLDLALDDMMIQICNF